MEQAYQRALKTPFLRHVPTLICNTKDVLYFYSGEDIQLSKENEDSVEKFADQIFHSQTNQIDRLDEGS